MNRDPNPRRRQPAGTPIGGQFAGSDGARADVALRDETFPPALVGAFEAAARADAATLWESVRHPDPLVRAEAATNPSLTADQADVLVTDRDWIVRWTMAQRTDLTAWGQLHRDPDPRVRHAVAGEADEVTRRRLLADPAVATIAAALDR
ncbi:MAG: hypothetical protein ACRD0G_13765 [Acidimicrobiales bacterium]